MKLEDAHPLIVQAPTFAGEHYGVLLLVGELLEDAVVVERNDSVIAPIE